jgi:uncharacterized protein YndB with AHSA1/START domain
MPTFHDAAKPERLTLVVRRSIRAPADRLFDAWTQREHLTRWWGPKGAHCPYAEIDLRIGGRFRIGNQFADGNVIWISGEFEHIARPSELIYTWLIEPASRTPERVTVRFNEHGGTTEVIVTHERIADEATRAQHEQGWFGCLDGLDAYLLPV